MTTTTTTTTPDPTQAMVDLYASALKLPGLRAAAAATAHDAQVQGQSHLTFLAACLRQEVESRQRHRLARSLGAAKFPAEKTLNTFDFRLVPQLVQPTVLALATGDFVRAHENVVCLGQSGTGKTHIGIALGHAAIMAGFRVRFTTAVALAQEMLAAQNEFRLPRYLKLWQNVDLVILDELGYLGLGPGGPLLFQFCAERYERRSILITTNLDFARWGDVFGDATLTGALLDRLTHRVHILLFQGESYRFRESQQRRQSTATGKEVTPTPDYEPSA